MSLSYLTQGSPERNYLKHLVLLHGSNREPWTEEQLRYFVAHFKSHSEPDDWLFDSFLFLNTKSSSGLDYVADTNEKIFVSGETNVARLCSLTPATKNDWDELLTFYFGEKGALRTLESTIKNLSAIMGKSPEHSRNVVLTLPYPHITQDKFGVIPPAAHPLDFSVRSQDLMHATQSRLDGESWFVNQIVRLWNEASFENINLLAVHWIFETIHKSWDVDDHLLLRGLRRHANQNGLKLSWIPSHVTYNVDLLEHRHDPLFDFAFLRPSVLVQKEKVNLDAAAAEAKNGGTGIAMDYCLGLNEPIPVTAERHIRFREYLNAGVNTGYMRESACAHLVRKNSLPKLFTHTEQIEREFYEDIYQFVKGTYKIKPIPSSSVDSHFRSGKDVAVAIDLGGTNLRMGVVDELGEVIHWMKHPTPGNRESIIRSILALVGDGIDVCTASGHDVLGIGISTGGRVDFKNGIIVAATSLIPDWINVPLKDMIERRFNLPVFVDNDGNCYAVAEKHFGKGRRLDNFIAVALGTGIGGGIYVDGKLLRGSSNFAAEIGHVSVDPDGPDCSCGGRGCVELFASGSGIARWASENPLLQHLVDTKGELSSKIIGEAARAGDASATSLLKAAGERLGVAMAGLVNVFNPESIIISGSLLELGDPYLETFKNTVRQVAMNSNSSELRIESSDFPQEGGILGAAALAFEEVVSALVANCAVNIELDDRMKK